MAKKMKEKKKPTTKFSCRTLMKSTIDSTMASIATVRQVYAKFCKETTLHGLKHTVAHDYHWLERFLWSVLTTSAFAGAVYCGLFQFSRYNSEPVVVSMQRDYRNWWTTFPAVTACFIDRILPDSAAEHIETLWNVTEESDPEKFSYYYGFMELLSDVSFRSNLQNFWKYQDDDTVKNLDLVQLAQGVHPTIALELRMSNNDREVQWIPVMTEMGICTTFNSQYAEHQLMLDSITWGTNDLLKCHYHSGQCFVRIDSTNNAIRYFIHSPFDIPTAISNPTGTVLPGEELVLDFKVVQIQSSSSIRNLRPEQRRCRYPDEWVSQSIKAYSFGLCQMNCRNKLAILFCGCRPFFFVKGDGEVCDAHGMACIGRNVEILINLPKNLAICSCPPQCDELNFYSHTKKIIFRITWWYNSIVCRSKRPHYRRDGALHHQAVGTVRDEGILITRD